MAALTTILIPIVWAIEGGTAGLKLALASFVIWNTAFPLIIITGFTLVSIGFICHHLFVIAQAVSLLARHRFSQGMTAAVTPKKA